MKYLHNFELYNEEIKISLNNRGLPKLTGTGKALRNLAVGGVSTTCEMLVGLKDTLPDLSQSSQIF